MKLDHHAEWTQIYNEAWRQMRDFFYAPNMNGVNWQAMHDKYAALLPFVNNRNDLTYLIGELIAELNNGHSYVGGGESPKAPRIKLGLLGAEFSRDPATRAYRIDRILPGENWDDETRSPLTAIGLNVKAGDYILAINGQPVAKLANLNEALIGTAGKQVTLRVNSKPTDDGARDITVVPTADEAPLYYLAWVQKNIDYVTKKTGGKVGYLHIPDMGKPGLNEFTKLYFPQIHKQGLIVDVRGNGGGFVSPMVIERLRRALVMVEMSRNNSVPQTNPPQTFIGPMDALMDEFSASDGDIFPFRFKTLGAGQAHRQTLVGRRDRHQRVAAVRGRRAALQAGVRAVFQGRQGLGDREPRRRSRHRRGQRPGEGVPRRRPAVGQGHRGDPRRVEDQDLRTAADPAVPGPEQVSGSSVAGSSRVKLK